MGDLILNLKNKRYGDLVALLPTGAYDNGSMIWNCRCECRKDCNKEVFASARDLVTGIIKRCKDCEQASQVSRSDKKEALRHKARELRNMGYTYAKIGGELGVSRQRAHQLLSDNYRVSA